MCADVVCQFNTESLILNSVKCMSPEHHCIALFIVPSIALIIVFVYEQKSDVMSPVLLQDVVAGRTTLSQSGFVNDFYPALLLFCLLHGYIF